MIPTRSNSSSDGNANTLQITLKRPATMKAEDGERHWLTRWFYCLPLGLLSGSLINLCDLCVLASMAGEYTRDALGEDAENPAKPDVPASMFRGFVVFLFFISGQLIFLANLPGGPSSEDALMTFCRPPMFGRLALLRLFVSRVHSTRLSFFYSCRRSRH